MCINLQGAKMHLKLVLLVTISTYTVISAEYYYRNECEQNGGVCKLRCGYSERISGTYGNNGCPYGQTCCLQCKDDEGCECRDWCSPYERNCGRCCDSRKMCCQPRCVADTRCDCKTSCNSATEKEDETGECCNSNLRCCTPCDETRTCSDGGGNCKNTCEFPEVVQGSCCNNQRCCVCQDDAKCNCKTSCDGAIEKEDTTGTCCDGSHKCCVSCTDTLTCNAASGNCRGTCGPSETDKGTCCNGQKCCVCQDDAKCNCKTSCDGATEKEDTTGTCCDGSHKCCVSCTDTLTCNAASGNCRGTCGPSETDKGTCCNGQKCCVCQDDAKCNCKTSCDGAIEKEDTTGTCCDGSHKCCVSCTDTITCNAASGNCKGTCGSSETDTGTCCNGQKCCVCQDDAECRCTTSCNGANEREDQTGKCCDGSHKCCKPCTDNPACRCISATANCLASEIEGAPCCDGSKCCLPCRENSLCTNCKSSCDTATEVDFGPCCSGDNLRCCLPCGACSNGGGTCQGTCTEKQFEVGPCCGGQVCCADQPSCDGAVFSPPRTCLPASDKRCGGGNIINGFCPFSNIKCCPAQCGFLCEQELGGECKNNKDCGGTSTNSDCCGSEKCCTGESVDK